MNNVQAYFYQLADFVGSRIHADETYLAYLAAEDSTFVRFNKSAVRQAGSVQQFVLALSLVSRQRRAESRITLSGVLDEDRQLVGATVETLRRDLGELPEDPYLLFNTSPQSSERIGDSQLPADDAMLDQVLSAANGHDLVGLYAAGALYRGFANSLGQRNWHRVDNFNLDWCLYHTADKAVKSSYAGTSWNAAELQDKMSAANEKLEVLRQPPKILAPGSYRVFLAPAAVNEIVELLSWEAFGVKAQRNKQSPLLKLEEGTAALHAGLSLRENSADGIAAGFQSDGFLKPPSVSLVEAGRHAGAMVSPRSAREFGLDTNGANAAEAPEAIDMAAGDLARADVLKSLDTGILIGNLHYLNFSDRLACRMTGMTRFATFWVENGKIQAPLNVMRFDDSAYRVLGENLLSLTVERDMIIDSSSYGERSTLSARLPGALVKDFALTL